MLTEKSTFQLNHILIIQDIEWRKGAHLYEVPTCMCLHKDLQKHVSSGSKLLFPLLPPTTYTSDVQ